MGIPLSKDLHENCWVSGFFSTRAKLLATGAAALGRQIDSVVKRHCSRTPETRCDAAHRRFHAALQRELRAELIAGTRMPTA
jgi:hypothetical protein